MTREPASSTLLPSFVQLHPELTHYWQRVLRPALGGISDDGELSVFLNHQIEQWEWEGRQHASLPLTAARLLLISDAAHRITLLKDALDTVRLRIRARIAAAEATLAKTYGVAA